MRLRAVTRGRIGSVHESPTAPQGPPLPNSIAADSGAPGADLDPGGPPQVLFVGRFDTTDPTGPKASWPGSRILTRFSGTSVSVKLSEYAEDWMDGAPSYWDAS